MSAWDDFKSYLKNLAGAPVGAAGSFAAGQVQQEAQKAGLSQQASIQASQSALAPLTKGTVQAQEQLAGKVVPVVTWLDEKVYSPFYQGLGATALAFNPDTYEGVSVKEGLERAWSGSKEIPLGNAVMDIYAGGANLLPDIGALAELNKVDIDIYDQQARDRVYERFYDESGQRVDRNGTPIEAASWIEKAFRGGSMVVDTTKQIVADPLVILGKGAKLARLAKLDVFRTPGAEFIEGVAKESNAAASARTTAARYERKLIDQEVESKRANTLLEDYNNGNVSIVDLADEINQIRIENGVKPLPQGQNPEVYVNDLTNYANRKRKDMATTQTKIDEALNRPGAVPTAANGVSDFVRQVIDGKMNWREIAAHRTIQEFSPDPEFLGIVLEQASLRGENAMYEVLNLASGGDPGAVLRLRDQHDDLLKLIDGAQRQVDAFEVEIQRVLETPNTDLAKRLNEHKQFYSDYIETLVKDDEYLRMITESDRQIQLVGTPFANYKKYNFVELWRADRAKVKAGLADGTLKPLDILRESGEFEWHRVQKSKLHKAVYVAQWVGHRMNRENPSGLVTVGGLDQFDAAKELQAFFDEGVFRGGKFWDVEPELRDQLKTEYMMAKDSIERKDVLMKIENESFRIMAERFGAKDITVPVELADGTTVDTPVWEIMRDAFFEKRAKDIAQFRKDKGFLVDTNGTMIGNPVMAAQFDYAVPMVNLKEIYSYYALHVSRDADLGDVIADPSTLQALYAGTKITKDGIILPAWSVVDRLWRADVLLRLGYPQRNILSEYMVLAQYGAGLPGLFAGNISQAGKNFIRNRHAHMQDIQKRAQATVQMADAKGGTGLKAAARVLSRSGLYRVSWPKYEKFANDNLELLREERQTILDDYEYLNSTGEDFASYPAPALERLDAQIALEEARLRTISERVAAKGERFGEKNIRGKQTITIGANEFAGVYQGEQGMAAQKLISSSGRQGFDRSPHASALKDMKLEGTGDYIKMQPTDKAYTPQLAGIINQQFRGSETVRMVIDGKSDDVILDYLNSPAGQRELEKLHWKQDVLKADAKGGTRKAGQEDPPMWDPNRLRRTGVLLDETPAENYLDFVRSQIVENYLPNPEIRKLVSEKFAKNEIVTSADINLYIPKDQRVPIHAEKMVEGGLFKALINPKFSNTEKIEMLLFDRFIKKMFTWLGQYPEDAFVSNPFADSVYQAKLREISKQWEANGIKPTGEDKLMAQEAARVWAVSESRKYLYRVVRENRIGSYIPLLSPFFQAQYSTTRRFGKLLYRNPDKSARVVWAWNQINTHSLEDEDGKRTLVMRIPPGLYSQESKLPDVLKNALRSKDSLSWDVNQFNLLAAGLRIAAPDVLPGDTETTAQKVGRWAQSAQSVMGTGPFVQIAATEWLKSDPSINTDNFFTEKTGVALPWAREAIEVFASPYPSENWYDPLTSAWNKRAMSILQKDGNKDWEKTKVVMLQNHLHAQQIGEEDVLSDDPAENLAMLLDLSGREATAFLSVRLVANLTAAFIPTYEGPMTPYVKEYQKLMEKSPATAYEDFLTQYPDMGYIAISLSKNLTGSSQSVDAVSIEQQYADTLDKAIGAASGVADKNGKKYVQMVTNGDVGSAALRDPYSGYWQRNKGNRVTVSAEEGLQSQQLRDGWGKYADMMDSFNAELERRGISRYSAAADQMNEIRRRWIAEQATKNSVWYTEYKAGMDSDGSLYAVNFMKTMLNDQEFVDSLPKDSWWFAAEKYIEMRDSLAQYIVDNNQGAATKEQLVMVEEYMKPLLKDETFAYYYNRYLDGDKFSLSKVGY